MLMQKIIFFLAMSFIASCDNSYAIGGMTPSIEQSQYTYDHNGRLVSVSYVNGTTINYAYDLEGNILTIKTQLSASDSQRDKK